MELNLQSPRIILPALFRLRLGGGLSSLHHQQYHLHRPYTTKVPSRHSGCSFPPPSVQPHHIHRKLKDEFEFDMPRIIKEPFYARPSIREIIPRLTLADTGLAIFFAVPPLATNPSSSSCGRVLGEEEKELGRYAEMNRKWQRATFVRGGLIRESFV